MLKSCASAFARVCLLAAIPAIIPAQDAQTILTNATKAMGAENLRTIQFTGMGSNAGIGQNVNPRAAWPVVRVKSYIREIDLNATTSHVQLVRVQAGADQTQNQYISSGAPWDTQFGFWLTPFGFLKGAMANNATVKAETIDGAKYNTVTFMLQNKYRVTGYINEQNMVERVRTSIDNDVLGDMPAEAWYSVYKDFSGVKFPTMIIEKQAGFPVLILAVSDVKPNAAINIQPPAQAATATPVVTVQSEKVADGVFYIRGGTHHSVAVEFADHIVVIEGPLNEQRSLAVIAEVKKLIPNKPIRYLVNTHHHFDHSGGLRTYVDEGAIIVTHEINKEFYEKAFAAPRTLNPDRLARSGKKATIETVGDKKVLSDGTRSLELHAIKGSPHNDGILMAFLPKEKILIEVDVYTPPAANAPAPAAAAPVNPSTANLVDNVERLKLDFEKILPLHGPGAVTRADLYAAIHKPAPSITEILVTKPAVAEAGGVPRGRGGRGGAAAAPAAEAGKQILETACTQCHSLSRVETKNLAKPDWQDIVDRMKGKGVDISESDTAALVDYLVKTYGPK
jgi:glyoxylase-like metal-dependent hydrolase (beta-lactamase superfamily II)